jgi:hypothetical protein
MFKYLWIVGLTIFFIILIILTIKAAIDVAKNDMTGSDGLVEFITYFNDGYTALFAIWSTILLFTFVASLICYIFSKIGG